MTTALQSTVKAKLTGVYRDESARCFVAVFTQGSLVRHMKLHSCRDEKEARAAARKLLTAFNKNHAVIITVIPREER